MDIQQKLNNLPSTPGVYIYKDRAGRVLYVGKAKVLRTRVRSYWRSKVQLEESKIQMVAKIANIETIATDNETEALVLEANLIRQHQPPYNVVLRDDKYYLFIKITAEDQPRVYPVRRFKKDGARYFGPYSSARSVRATLQLLRRIFPFHGEKDSPREIIFPHPLFTQQKKESMKSVDQHGKKHYNLQPTTYNLNIKNIIRFLSGQREDIMTTLQAGMRAASQQNNYEQAAIFRDQLQAVHRLEGSQKVWLTSKESFDIISVARQPAISAANVFQIRQGKLLNKNTFLLKHRAHTPPVDTLRQFILQYYSVAQDIPAVIMVPIPLADSEALASWINEENPSRFTVPQRGKKKQLLKMGETNAQHLLEEQATGWQTEQRAKQALSELLKAIGLKSHSAPAGAKASAGRNASRDDSQWRIEIYDISNIQGRLATASMVVFIDGRAANSLYRKFRLRSPATPNDFVMIQETLRRRFATRNKSWPLPDLVIIDGGKGQLSSAQKILDELGLTIPLIAIAKREEEIFVRDKPSIHLPYDAQALFLIQRMRDEAHRFTLSYHRLLRRKQQQRSVLDEVPNIGPKTKKRLLNHFGSLKAIRQASPAEIAQLIGEAKSKTLSDYL